MAMVTIVAALQVFLTVIVTALVRSTSLASSVVGGILQGAIRPSPGVATCTTALAVYKCTTETTTGEVGVLFVAWGIEQFDYLTI